MQNKHLVLKVASPTKLPYTQVMFQFIRFLFYLLLFVVVLRFVVTVPLGQRTIYQHLYRIYSTPESQDAIDESKKAIREGVGKLQKQLDTDDKKNNDNTNPSQSSQSKSKTKTTGK